MEELSASVKSEPISSQATHPVNHVNSEPRANNEIEMEELSASVKSEPISSQATHPVDDCDANNEIEMPPKKKEYKKLPPLPNPLGLSKNQLKKQARAEFRKEHHMKKRRMEREKRKEQRRNMWEKIQKENPDVKYVTKKERKKEKADKLRLALEKGQKICVDMSFCDSMIEKEIRQLARQVNLLYSSTAKSEVLMSLNIASLKKGSFLHSELQRHCNGFDHYILNVSDKSVEQLFENEKLVYLSPDAEEVMQSIDKDAVYVIGGIVDGSPKKFMTKSKADNLGVRSMRLPILETMQKSKNYQGHTTILTLNQVYDILINFSATGDWLSALERSVPMRKGFVSGEKSDISGADMVEEGEAKNG